MTSAVSEDVSGLKLLACKSAHRTLSREGLVLCVRREAGSRAHSQGFLTLPNAGTFHQLPNLLK